MNITVLSDTKYEELAELLESGTAVIIVPRSQINQFAAKHKMTSSNLIALMQDVDYCFGDSDVLVEMASSPDHILWSTIEDELEVIFEEKHSG